VIIHDRQGISGVYPEWLSLLVLFSFAVIMKEKRTPAHGQFSEKSPWQQDFSRLKLPVRASFLPTFFLQEKSAPD
jgi:hypothetical protein